MEDQNQSLIKANPGLLAALSNGSISIDVLSKDILVLECIVAGTSFRNLKDVEPNLAEEVKLDLKREIENEYDEFAIAIYFDEVKLGYVPREKNETIARLLDNGKKFFASIETKEWEGNWLRIEIKIFLKD